MTILNVSLTNDAAILSQDTAMLFDDQPAGHICKVVSIPSKKMVIGQRGNLDFVFAWAALVQTIPGNDIQALNKFVPTALRELAKQVEPQFGQTICHVGWSETDNAPACFVYTESNDFEPQVLQFGQFVIAPAELATDDREYPELIKASQGNDLIGFHRKLAANQLSSASRGLFENTFGAIGGTLTTFTITSQGVTQSNFKLDDHPTVDVGKVKALTETWLNNHPFKAA